MDVTVFDESITSFFKKLCIQQLKNNANRKRALVINKNFELSHVLSLQKRLYRRLFVSLHSPIVLPTSKELTADESNLNKFSKYNVFNSIAIDFFNLRLQGYEKDAERLSYLCQTLKELNSTTAEIVLQLLHLLSNSVIREKKSSRLKYFNNDAYISSMFQFDAKALELDESGIDLFGSAHDVDNNRFFMNNDINTIFLSTPGATLAASNLYLRNLKESKYSERTRCSLFGGLTNSLTTSMEVALNLPDLPKDSYDMEMTLPSNGQDLYAQEISVDEGFHEISTTKSDFSSIASPLLNLEVWDQASTIEPRKVFEWEMDGSYNPRSSYGYLTELGDKAFDCMYTVKICEIEQITGKTLKENTVSQQQVFQDSLNVLIGVQSLTYSFHPSTFSMKPLANIRCTGISCESLHGLMTKFALLGTNYRQLRKFCSHHAERPVTGHSGGSLLKAFIDALNEILHSYWYAVFTVTDLKDLSLTELWHLFERFSKQLKLLADLCLCSEAFKRVKKSTKPKFPVGPGLLSYLYSLSVKNASTEHYPLLLYLFKAASLPYIKFISNWLFNGTCSDAFGEFFVFMDHQYLTYRDKYFWTQGFQMKRSKNAIPLFLDDMAQEIFACGKAINLLRLTNIQHYIFDQQISPPVLTITFSSDRLEVIDQNTKNYIRRTEELQKAEEEKKERKKLEKEDFWKMKLAAEKATSELALAKINEMEQKIQNAIKEKKGKELQRLKQQFEEAVQERKRRREKKLEEDQKFLNELKQIEEKEDEIKQKARDELIAFYQALTDQADQRERRARWTIERYELSNKRLEFLTRDQTQLEIELERSKQGTFLGPLDEVDNRKDASATKKSVQSFDKSVLINSIVSTSFRNTETKDGEGSLDPSHSSELFSQQETNVLKAKDVLYPGSYPELNSSKNIPLEQVPDTDQRISEPKETYPATFPDDPTTESDVTVSLLSTHDQNNSQAKSIIYPESTGENLELMTSSYHNEFEYDMTLIETRPPIGNTAYEGSAARDILYPSAAAGSDTGRGPPVEGGLHVTEGRAMKNLIYHVDIATVEEREVDQRQVKDGAETKYLLYPGDITTATIVAGDIKYSEDGAETKSLLYNTSGDKRDSVDVFTRKGGVQMDSGQRVKDALYSSPSEPNHEGSFTASKGAMQVDGGHQVKDVLYPSSISGLELSEGSFVPSKRGVTVATGHRVKNSLYPSAGPQQETSYDGVVSGMYNEGGETKNLLYPETSTAMEIKEREKIREGIITNNRPNPPDVAMGETFTEGSETKSLLYPGEHDATNKTGSLRQFEKLPTMQTLLYPDTSQLDELTRKETISKGFEPPTRIKEMMYPDSNETKTKIEHVVTPLRPEDVWMDIAVEPYVDDYSVIDKDPHPYKTFETEKSYSDYLIQSENDKHADVIKKLPLETIIKRSLTTPIQAQISLVNKAVIKYFMEELHIRDHFDAFRKFLLLEDGEFGHSLCSQLFQKISSGMKPRDFCNTIRLNNIIIEALRSSLYASRIEYSTQLTFSLKSVPEVFQPSDVAVLDFLELRYQVPWPCNIIVTENSITKYNKVFSFLIRLKRANWSLQEVWVNLKKAGHSRKAAMSPQLTQLQLFRHEMQHFVNNLERYTVNQILHVSWEEFQQDLEKKVNSLDDLHRCHTVYQKRIIFRSLLSKNAAPVYKIINDIFGMISKFEARLAMTPWKTDEQSGYVTHPMFGKLQQVHGDFKQCIDFLFSVISKLVRRGYQDHLADLLLQVNFNSYYSTAVIHQ